MNLKQRYYSSDVQENCITVPNIKLNNFILTPEKTAIRYLRIEIDENLSRNKEIEILAESLKEQTAFCRS